MQLNKWQEEIHNVFYKSKSGIRYSLSTMYHIMAYKNGKMLKFLKSSNKIFNFTFVHLNFNHTDDFIWIRD